MSAARKKRRNSGGVGRRRKGLRRQSQRDSEGNSRSTDTTEQPYVCHKCKLCSNTNLSRTVVLHRVARKHESHFQRRMSSILSAGDFVCCEHFGFEHRRTGATHRLPKNVKECKWPAAAFDGNVSQLEQRSFERSRSDRTARAKRRAAQRLKDRRELEEKEEQLRVQALQAAARSTAVLKAVFFSPHTVGGDEADKRLVAVTNLTRSLFDFFVSKLIESVEYKCGRSDSERNLLVQRNVLLTSHRVWTGSPLNLLGVLWGLSESVASRICTKTMSCLGTVMRTWMIKRLVDGAELLRAMDAGHTADFRTRFKFVVEDKDEHGQIVRRRRRFYLIADCFPIRCGGSCDPVVNRALYGGKYSCHCMKQLVISTPDGTPVIVPPLLVGVATDADVIKTFGIVEMLDQAARLMESASPTQIPIEIVVLADKAFLVEMGSEDERNKFDRVMFLIPESMKSEYAARSARLTRVLSYGYIEPDRVVIENIIGRIQDYGFLRGRVPNNGLKFLREAVDVVCGSIAWKIEHGEQLACRVDLHES
jgi:DDE superfamily endonuclease